GGARRDEGGTGGRGERTGGGFRSTRTHTRTGARGACIGGASTCHAPAGRFVRHSPACESVVRTHPDARLYPVALQQHHLRRCHRPGKPFAPALRFGQRAERCRQFFAPAGAARLPGRPDRPDLVLSPARFRHRRRQPVGRRTARDVRTIARCLCRCRAGPGQALQA
ncbi:hypothetical protein OY671_011157, partial [Metschnikowia pulcherrima]